MTFIKVAEQLKVVWVFMTSDFSRTRKLKFSREARSSMSFCTKLLQAASANERRTFEVVI